ncbi:MAG TPA: pseudouridine synthase, partial [Spirochaetota bacterium]|nr:pseudouridine synthase [Spirochaetota bacterium]
MKIYKNIRIVYEDNHIIVVEKPAGILSQKDKTNEQSLLDMIKEYIKVTYHKHGNVYAGLVHRLDKQVSGIMVFAKTSKAASRLFL